jgi:hypothetical protein
MKSLNVLESPVYPQLPKSENVEVGSISRDEIANRAWLAGIMDGEGSFGIHGNNARGMGQLKLAVKVTCPYMIQRITTILVQWNTPFHINYAKFAKEVWKEQLSLEVTGMRSIQRILNHLLPYFTTKKEQATILLDYLDWRLNEVAFHTRNREVADLINQRRDETKALLTAAKQKRFSFQRLPRAASSVLDLSKLEVMV